MDIKTWVSNIIEIYDKSETVDLYKKRSNNESTNIKSILKAIQNQEFQLLPAQSKGDFVHLLKAADSISLDVGTNYLEQFIQVPDVQKIIVEKLTPNNLAKARQKAFENEQSGNLPNFPKTIAEDDKIDANYYLSLKGTSPEQKISDCMTQIKQRGAKDYMTFGTKNVALNSLSVEEECLAKLSRVILRQHGMNPGKMKMHHYNRFVTGNSTIYFDLDVPDKEPIYHGMKQEQGLSIAQQEELKNKQEAEQRHEKEQEDHKKDRENQMKTNNQYSADAKKKREDEQSASEESSRKMSAKDSIMQQAQQYKSQMSNSNLFMESLRFDVENTNRTNLLQSQSQANTHKSSKSMGQSR